MHFLRKCGQSIEGEYSMKVGPTSQQHVQRPSCRNESTKNNATDYFSISLIDQKNNCLI